MLKGLRHTRAKLIRRLRLIVQRKRFKWRWGINLILPLTLHSHVEGWVLPWQEDDVPTFGLMRLIDQSGAFDFWSEAGEDIYAAEDGEPV